MNSMLCSRCKKRMAVVFVTRMEGDKTFNEGLCLQCAKELGIKPVEDLMNKMGISGDELDAISEQMMNFDENGDKLLDIFNESKKYGNEDRVFYFSSTSKPFLIRKKRGISTNTETIAP